MLPETAITKLSWTFGQTGNLEKVKRIMLTNFAGEFASRSIYL